jgi:aldehyde dehydrogenase (NAD+)
MSYLDSGKKDTELITGGDREGQKGCFIQPTIFLNPSKEAKIYKEEVFGPVLTIVTFEMEDEVVTLAKIPAMDFQVRIQSFIQSFIV